MDSSFIDFAITHNSEDLELAEALLNHFEAAGLVGWMDSRAFYSPLVSAERQIERAFRKARFICLLVGDRYRDSAWCREEYSLGLRSEADLSMTRVLVVTESSAGGGQVPAVLARAPRFVWADKTEIKKCSDLVSEGRNTAPHLAEWSDTLGRSALIVHLSTVERLKLVGDHLEYLLSNFTNGLVDPRDHESAIRLGLIAGSPTARAVHLSLAVALEMCWRWTSEVVGRHTLRHFLEESIDRHDVPDLPICDIRALFVKVLPIFPTYFATAAGRRGNPPEVTEADLFAICDYVICGFLAVIYKANRCEQELIDGVLDLLKFVEAHGDRHLAAAANYLSRGVPTIGLPKFRTLRLAHIYDLLHDARS